MTGRTKRTVEERFWDKVQPGHPDECWEWQGRASSTGYGRIGEHGRLVYAHRLSFEMDRGPIPSGQVIDHKCRNRLCVNPSHLQAVTDLLNQQNRSGANRNSRTGIRGVTPEGKRYRARANYRGQNYDGGVHNTLEQATAAVIALRLKLYSNNLLDRAS